MSKLMMSHQEDMKRFTACVIEDFLERARQSLKTGLKRLEKGDGFVIFIVDGVGTKAA